MKKILINKKGKLLFAISMVILSSIANIYIAFVFKRLIDVTQIGNLKEFYKIGLFTFLFILVTTLIGVLTKISKYLYIKDTMFYLKNYVFNAVIIKDISEFKSENSSKYISLITNDIKMIEDDYINNIFSLIETTTAFISAIISLFILSYQIAVTLIIMSMLSVVIPQIFGNKLSKSRGIYSNELEKFIAKAKDILTGFEVVKSFKIENKILNEYSKLNASVENSKFKFNLLNAFVDVISELVGSLMFMSVFTVGVFLTIKGKMTLGTMIACLQLTNYIVNPVFMSIHYLNKIKSIKSISDKILNISNQSKNNTIYLPKNNFTNYILMENVNFSYEKNKQVLKNINIKIEKNKKYAFVGYSGSGKSTILKLLLKQYENYDGMIKIDDVDLRKISSDDIYSLISVIHQNVFVFDDTILNNITLYNDYAHEDINEVIKLSGLTHFIEKLDNGLISSVGEEGYLISGGEKQRIAIARALIRKTPILMLDEATASLDNETAYSIEETILSMNNITALVVTHRLWENLLKKYDTIFVLKDGEIIERGSFEDLINKKGYFYSLYNIESSKY